VICLDTNYLVRGLVKGAKESAELIEWYQSGEVLLSAGPAWYEFLSGPVIGPQISAIRAFLSGGISLLAPLPCIPNYEASSFLTN
jgi:hypothetical protein